MRCPMWFGTKDYSLFIETPQTGADVSPQAWGVNGTHLNGSGYVFNSFNTHRQYQYSWGSRNSREYAQLIRSFYEGTFGRGLIYFQEPTTYSTNVLPARWADPSITTDFEGPQLARGVDPTTTPTSNFARLQLPVRTAVFDFSKVSHSTNIRASAQAEGLFIPIPDGYQLNLGAFFRKTGLASASGVYVVNALQGGAAGSAISQVTALDPTASNLFPDVYTKAPGDIGVYLWFGKVQAGATTLSITAMHARLSPIGQNPGGEHQWVGGQGNAGVRFVQPPTYININGVDGGQIECAATFKESLF